MPVKAKEFCSCARYDGHHLYQQEGVVFCNGCDKPIPTELTLDRSDYIGLTIFEDPKPENEFKKDVPNSVWTAIAGGDIIQILELAAEAMKDGHRIRLEVTIGVE